MLLLAEPFLLCCSWLSIVLLLFLAGHCAVLHLAEKDAVLAENCAVCAFLIFAEHGAVLFLAEKDGVLAEHCAMMCCSWLTNVLCGLD